VTDNGPGIPGEALPHLFERFYRADQGRANARADGMGGTGLGLSICRSLVEAHGGRIDVTSREGMGTTFHVLLPVAPELG
jgi:signal transduction histidine kinase